MSIDSIREFIADYPILFIPLAIIIAYLLYRLTKLIFARSSFWIAFRTETVYDDLMVDALMPFRVAWIVPLLLFYYFADFAYADLPLVQDIVLFLIIWVLVDFSISLLTGINEIYEHRPRYTGTPVAGYIGLLKVIAVIAGAVITISVFSDVPPAVLLGGVGAWLAVLLLIFRDTILAFLASVQISTQQLVKDGDWIEVPGYNANGIVNDISLNSITVRNFDNTLTVIPTYKIVDVAFRNYRGMQESGGRRMIRTVHFDVHSIKFCEMALLEKMSKYDLVADIVNEQKQKFREYKLEAVSPVDFPLDGPQITNLDLFISYVRAYLKSRKDLHQRRLKAVIQTSEPGRDGIAVEIYAFTKATDWVKHAATRDEVTIHILAAAPHFDLRVFQDSTDIEFLVMGQKALE
ncbi:MAG TPA: mechanosensitive ion channel domain-containing protein [Anaerolineae bacterium]|nr:mechanosensitive ion channel domain-containing protein [Anaerolineae bacterium]